MFTNATTSATITLPDKIQKQFCNSNTIGTWKHELDSALKSKGWINLVTMDLQTVIRQAKDEETMRVTKVDPEDKSIRTIFQIQFDINEARSLFSKEESSLTDAQIIQKAYEKYIYDLTKTNQ